MTAGYFGCTCDATDVPHCHTRGNCPAETPSTSGRSYCVYGGIGCNVDHNAIARQSTSVSDKVDHVLLMIDHR